MRPCANTPSGAQRWRREVADASLVGSARSAIFPRPGPGPIPNPPRSRTQARRPHREAPRRASRPPAPSPPYPPYPPSRAARPPPRRAAPRRAARGSAAFEGTTCTLTPSSRGPARARSARAAGRSPASSRTRRAVRVVLFLREGRPRAPAGVRADGSTTGAPRGERAGARASRAPEWRGGDEVRELARGNGHLAAELFTLTPNSSGVSRGSTPSKAKL